MGSNEQMLKSYLSKYKYADIAKKDILGVFSQYKDLRPTHGPFIFNDGSQKDLVNLDGTIPVNYRGNIYNIPIGIFILDTHPYNPPICYVKPTNTMQIKQGTNVDANGKVDLPYLRDWRYPQSDLLGLIQILVIVFSEEPPVFSRSASSQNRPPPYQGGSQQPPYPAQGGFPMPQPYSSGYPQQGGQGGQAGSYPNSGFQGYPNYPNQPAPGGYGNSGFSGYPGQQPQGYPSSTPGYPAATSGYPYSGGVQTESTTTAANRPGSNMTVTEEHLRMSLLSAVEDKMKRRLREIFEQAQAEMNVLYKTQSDLNTGKTKLEQIFKDLEQEKEEIESNIKLLKDKDRELKEALQKVEHQDKLDIDEAAEMNVLYKTQSDLNTGKTKLEQIFKDLEQEKDKDRVKALQKVEHQDKLDIDEAVITTTPLYRQLLNSFAEEQAIEDAIYYLGEALRKNVLEPDVFLKQVRELSRQQFMKRALIQKCREKAGLPPLA
ncbi:TSG101 [Mytilus coruscus]|uniref:TSG101 n=1 Tax=Mytilus coruscus TaxID=42192 RepID=A0A6J8CH56_MYTCO|nr:TSG101 [Mytilus coruscus]